MTTDLSMWPERALSYDELAELDGLKLTAAITAGEAEPAPVVTVESLLESRKSRVAGEIAPYMCGDCNVELSNGQNCAHIAVAANGARRVLG